MSLNTSDKIDIAIIAHAAAKAASRDTAADDAEIELIRSRPWPFNLADMIMFRIIWSVFTVILANRIILNVFEVDNFVSPVMIGIVAFIVALIPIIGNWYTPVLLSVLFVTNTFGIGTFTAERQAERKWCLASPENIAYCHVENGMLIQNVDSRPTE